MAEEELRTTCCIAGGGPAGIMLGYLLARAGIAVTVLEKHDDFFRDFRGDTVHPSTLEVLGELGLLEEALRVPHQRIYQAGGVYGDFPFVGPDFRYVPARCRFVALMPQWDFLNFLSGKARQFPGFDLRMGHEAMDLLREGERVAGVAARAGERMVHVRADLVVGCDGRHSTVRQAARLPRREYGVPIDVLWFRLSRRPDDPDQVLGRINYGRVLILIQRGDYFQAGLIVRKGSFDEIRQRGMEEFREGIRQIAPFPGDRVAELREWEQVKLLTVQVNRLLRWYRPGLLCIGDAAHAMSPAGGVGINLAIQDAVAAANVLTGAPREALGDEAVLARIERRREFPTRVTQAAQVLIHRNFDFVFRQPGPLQAPWQLKAAVRIPGIHAALGMAAGIGVRPEHVRGARRMGFRGALLRGAAVGVALGAALGVLVQRRRGLAAGPCR
ncbi:MAG TPA: FAD-dependent oxidoreductase [Bryobacteraceae bacterium]|nr:FAD-dependent oxidoreductase [Bryobacteraceae bacterium]